MREPRWLTALVWHLTPPFRWGDRQVQRAVDAASFALARRGIPKSIQTYALEVAWVAGLIAGHASNRAWFTAGIWGLCGLLWSLSWHRNLRQDEQAEARGQLTGRDRPIDGPLGTFLKMLFLTGFALDAYAVAINHEPNRAYFTCFAISALAGLAECYLRRTPRQPPPARQTQHVPATSAA